MKLLSRAGDSTGPTEIARHRDAAVHAKFWSREYFSTVPTEMAARPDEAEWALGMLEDAIRQQDEINKSFRRLYKPTELDAYYPAFRFLLADLERVRLPRPAWAVRSAKRLRRCMELLRECLQVDTPAQEAALIEILKHCGLLAPLTSPQKYTIDGPIQPDAGRVGLERFRSWVDKSNANLASFAAAHTYRGSTAHLAPQTAIGSLVYAAANQFCELCPDRLTQGEAGPLQSYICTEYALATGSSTREAPGSDAIRKVIPLVSKIYIDPQNATFGERADHAAMRAFVYAGEWYHLRQLLSGIPAPAADKETDGAKLMRRVLHRRLQVIERLCQPSED